MDTNMWLIDVRNEKFSHFFDAVKDRKKGGGGGMGGDGSIVGIIIVLDDGIPARLGNETI